jgi:hypothetical protein
MTLIPDRASLKGRLPVRSPTSKGDDDASGQCCFHDQIERRARVSLVMASDVVTGTTMTSAEVVSVQNALPPRFQPRAQWAAALPIINTIGQFESAADARLYWEVTQIPRALLGRRLNEASTMDSTIAAGATADYVLCSGDWSNFVIADRLGSRLEVVPHLVGANRRPTRQGCLLCAGRRHAATSLTGVMVSTQGGRLVFAH